MYVFSFMGACVPGCTCGGQRTTCQEESFYSPLARDRVSLVSVSMLRILVWLAPELLGDFSCLRFCSCHRSAGIRAVYLAFYMGSGVRLRLLGFHGKCFYSLSCFHNLYLLFFILSLLLFSYLFPLSLSLSLFSSL